MLVNTFAVELACTMDVDGEKTAVDILDDATRELSVLESLFAPTTTCRWTRTAR